MANVPPSDLEVWRQFFCAAVTGLATREKVGAGVRTSPHVQP